MNTAERRVTEKNSYRKLIAQMQTTYPHLTRDKAFKGILALRARNSGSLSGMTMLDIIEGVMKIVDKPNDESKECTTDDADPEPQNQDESVQALTCKKEKISKFAQADNR